MHTGQRDTFVYAVSRSRLTPLLQVDT